MQRRTISVNYLAIRPLGGEMNGSDWKNPPAGAVVPGADGWAYLVPDGAHAAGRRDRRYREPLLCRVAYRQTSGSGRTWHTFRRCPSRPAETPRLAQEGRLT